MTTKIAIFGAGQIGTAFQKLVQRSSMGVRTAIFDTNLNSYNHYETDKLDYIISQNDVVVCATPYDATLPIADSAIKHGKIYLDFTEDVAIGRAVMQRASLEGNSCLVIPHCGLAPGAVNIIAYHLAKQFDTVHEIKMRVGALPKSVSNKLRYYRSWSTDGLVNECTKSGQAISNGELVSTVPLEGLNTMIIDGTEYEAINTSGGVGTLIRSDIVRKNPNINLSYQTLRYPGHTAEFKRLLNALGPKHLVEWLNVNVPFCAQDMVQIFIEVTGFVGSQYTVKSYSKQIYGENGSVSGTGLSAIQITTAGAALAVLQYVLLNRPKGNVVFNEQFDFEDLLGMFGMAPYIE